jgi:hypothetical protein
MSVNEYYEMTLELLDKTIDAPTPIATTGRIINGNLLPFKARVELVNTGNSKTDNGVLTLRIPPDGTFIRTEPILTNEEAKDKYVIQAQIRQADGLGGTRKGKLFRFTIGAPTIQDDPETGETLKISLIPTEYRVKEHLTSRQLLFKSPRTAFEQRCLDYNSTKGSSEPSIIIDANNVDPLDDSIQLPDDNENLKLNWEPLAPTKTHDLLWEIVNRLSQPAVGGGTFQDYYFDFEASNATPFAGDITSGSINAVDVKAEKFGEVDSGVILDPLSVISPVDAEKDKTIMTDLVKWKNHIIAEGSTTGGSLPMEKARFNSEWQHAQARAEWSNSATYYKDDVLYGTSVVKRTDTSPFDGKQYVRFFEFIGTNGTTGVDPVSISQADWKEDFSVIPEYNANAQYNEFEVITETSGGSVTFYQLLPVHITNITGTGTVTVTTSPNHGLSSGQFVSIKGTNNFDVVEKLITVTGVSTFTYSDAGHATPESPSIYDAWVLGSRVHNKGDGAPSTLSPDWQNAFNDIAESQYTAFYSYTPWTSDYDLQLSNLSGTPAIEAYDNGKTYVLDDEVSYLGKWYINELGSTGVLPTSSPTWRKLSDTIPTWIGCVPDMNFERANFDRIKSEDQFEQISLKAVNRAERTQTSIPANEIVNGARFLINGTGVGTDFAGNNNKIAEWFQPPFSGAGEWKFSKSPSSGTNEMVVDLQTAQIWRWDGSSWSVFWTPKPDNGGVTSPMHPVTNGDELGLNPISPNAIKTGFGLIDGSTGIPAQAIRLTYHWDHVFGSKLNLGSRGAWWVQHLPMPFRQNAGGSGRDVGDIYANSTLDTVNLDKDRKGNQGWNNGLDSEDLGRISAITMKVRCSAYNDQNILNDGYPNMPFTAWAIDIFGRIWFENFTLARNGQYDFVKIQFGRNAPQKLYHNRIDELFEIWGFTFSQNFFLKEKEFTGIAFDWRFVKSWGIFWNIGYDDNKMYVGVRDNFVETITAWAKQVGNNLLSFFTAGGIPHERYIIDHVHLDIDELAFEKQLYANSDDTTIATARTEIAHLSQETDYLNLKARAKGEKGRKQFVNQQWHMLGHGDVRLRLGQKFKAIGSRVPEQPSNYSAWVPTPTVYSKGDKVSRGGYVWQSLRDVNSAKTPEDEPQWWVNLNESVCAEVKHIIDGNGYTMQILGVRKFVFSG